MLRFLPKFGFYGNLLKLIPTSSQSAVTLDAISIDGTVDTLIPEKEETKSKQLRLMCDGGEDDKSGMVLALLNKLQDTTLSSNA